MNVIIPGTFDCFHEGHKRLIDYAWLLSNKTFITIAINSQNVSGKDLKDVMRVRGEKITKYVKSKGIKAELYIIFDPEDTVERAKEIAPCFWLTGRDWNLNTTSLRNNVEQSFWEENEIYLIYKDRIPDMSSTKLRGENEI